MENCVFERVLFLRCHISPRRCLSHSVAHSSSYHLYQPCTGRCTRFRFGGAGGGGGGMPAPGYMCFCACSRLCGCVAVCGRDCGCNIPTQIHPIQQQYVYPRESINTFIYEKLFPITVKLIRHGNIICTRQNAPCIGHRAVDYKHQGPYHHRSLLNCLFCYPRCGVRCAVYFTYTYLLCNYYYRKDVAKW